MDVSQPKLEPVTIWHNPDCSKSRRALEMLAGLGWVDIVVREYLEDPPSAAEIRDVLDKLSRSDRPVTSPRGIMRTGEAPYAANGLDDPALSDEQLLDALVRFPVLIQRPIVICGERAALGRPDYRALEVLRPTCEIPPIHEVLKSKIKEEGI